MSFFSGSSIVRRLAAAACLLAAQVALAGTPEYVLGAGDLIKVTVFQNPDLTVETRVSESGAITYPLLGPVPVGGLPVGTAEEKLARLLREGGFVTQPQVNILVEQVRGNQVSVLGQVNRPGRYPLEMATNRLSDVLALAGGITPLGSDQVVLTGVREGKPFRLDIDMPSLFLSEKADKDVAVRGGDVLYIHRAPQFYIYGEVQRPGAYRIERDMTVMQALAQGGGTTLRGTQRGIRIHRRDAGGKVLEIEPAMDEVIRNDDVLYVRESLF